MSRAAAWLLVLAGGWALVAGLAGCGGAQPAEEFPYHTPGVTEEAAAPITPTPTAAVHGLTTPRPPQVLGSLYEQRLLSVEWPRRLREGDSDWVRLRLEVDQRGTITPTVTVEGHDIAGQPVHIPDLYATHHIYLQARLDAVGLSLEPEGLVQAPLQPGQVVEVYWTVRGDAPGRYQAVLTAHLNLVPKSTPGTARQLLLAHQLFQVEVVNFLGLSGFWVRLGGVFSALLGVLLQLPDLLELWERLRGRGARRTAPAP